MRTGDVENGGLVDVEIVGLIAGGCYRVMSWKVLICRTGRGVG